MEHPFTDDLRHELLKALRIIKVPAPIRETPLVELPDMQANEREIYRVTTDGRRLYLRAAPSQQSKGLHAYKPGTEVAGLSLSEDGKWRQVAILDGGASGWMWNGNLQYIRPARW